MVILRCHTARLSVLRVCVRKFACSGRYGVGKLVNILPVTRPDLFSWPVYESSRPNPTLSISNVWISAKLSLGALTLPVRRQEGHPVCKELGVALLMVTIWLELCTSCTIKNGDILVPANPGSPRKWPLSRRERKRERERISSKNSNAQRFVSYFPVSNWLTCYVLSPTNSAAYPRSGDKLVVTYPMWAVGWRLRGADCGDGMSASGTARLKLPVSAVSARPPTGLPIQVQHKAPVLSHWCIWHEGITCRSRGYHTLAMWRMWKSEQPPDAVLSPTL